MIFSCTRVLLIQNPKALSVGFSLFDLFLWPLRFFCSESFHPGFKAGFHPRMCFASSTEYRRNRAAFSLYPIAAFRRRNQRALAPATLMRFSPSLRNPVCSVYGYPRGFPPPRYVPPSGFLNLLAAFPRTTSAALFHATSAYKVRLSEDLFECTRVEVLPQPYPSLPSASRCQDGFDLEVLMMPSL